MVGPGPRVQGRGDGVFVVCAVLRSSLLRLMSLVYLICDETVLTRLELGILRVVFIDRIIVLGTGLLAVPCWFAVC